MKKGPYGIINFRVVPETSLLFSAICMKYAVGLDSRANRVERFIGYLPVDVLAGV